MNANSLTAPASPLPTDPLHARFGCPLPAAMREVAQDSFWAHMTSACFTDRFSPATGPLRLGSWTETKAGGGRTEFAATLGIDDTIIASTATAYGPIEALTTMLYEAGFHIEIASFHQQAVGSATATFVLGERDGRQHWSAAIEDDSHLSSVRAIIGAINLLHR